MINPFDEIGADPEHSKDEQAKYERLDYLIHKVFAQTDEGIELLEEWKKTLLFHPTAQPGYDSIHIGMNEGTKQFIRNILLTIEKVQDE